MQLLRSIDPTRLPVPADANKVELGWVRWREAVAGPGVTDCGRLAGENAADPAARALFDGIFGNSDFLTNCIVQSPNFTHRLLVEGVDAAYADCLETASTAGQTDDLTHLEQQLRQAKRQAALAIAVADIAGAWPLDRVMARLSTFAEACLGAAVRLLLRKAGAQGLLDIGDEPEEGSGLIVLGMGKLGAHELNYSSDIDLIVLYDSERLQTSRPERLQQTFVRLTRDLVRVLEARLPAGYVFRTDLRLRPDPGATPAAISVLAAETYYESMGQNWERAAMIKARPVAGDRAAGEAFIRFLQPFLWRRHLDFAAIEDVRAIKRQIHAHKGGSTVAVEGHNIKLGRGGIREIELFAQTQQLIWGGREPGLRQRRTVDALQALVAHGRVRQTVATEMSVAYAYLRRLENRLQMVADQQTHSLPKQPDGVDAIAAFLGYRDGGDFRAELLDHLRTVESHYAALFEESAQLTRAGSLVFTGVEHDPETLRTLSQLGFQEPGAISSAVRRWHHGRYRATRSTRARELLTELMPVLLETLGGSANPDQAFRRFDAFLSGLPAGVQLFSLFQSNPNLLGLVAEIVGSAPRLADWLSRHPLLLDGVLDPGFYEGLPDKARMAADLDEKLQAAGDMQDIMDISRRWANDARFCTGTQLLRGLADPGRAARSYSEIAETVLQQLLPRLSNEFAAQHGRCPGDGFAVIALGKLGGRELTAGSDLDLVFIYDQPADGATSNGVRPLPAPQYYQRLGQRLINALTALTGEGRLYEVDMRLRPSGNAGPLAVSLAGFEAYHSESAWTWEHLALTRARVVAGAAPLAERIGGVLRRVLCVGRDPDALTLAVDDMHARTFRENAATSPWRIKHYPGGLVDCEFIAQYLQLRHAHAQPAVLDANTGQALTKLRDLRLLDQRTANRLLAAVGLWQGVQGLLRLTMEGEVDAGTLPLALKRKLAAQSGAGDFDQLREEIERRAAEVRAIYDALIGAPAAEIRARRAADPPRNIRRSRGPGRARSKQMK